MNGRRVRIVSFLSAWMSSAALAASLSGTVYDPSGAVVPGASIALTDSTGGMRQSTATNAGQFSFADLPAGRYDLEVRVPGFAPLWKNIQLEENAGKSSVAILRMGVVTETVEVRANGVPAKTAGAPRRVRVGGNVQATKLISQVRPVYPERARAAGVEGTVILRAVIQKDGAIGDLLAFPGAEPDLADAAETAVRQWRYSPTLLNGEPVEIETHVEVRFRLGS
ncbi:MAG: TonB family protein [Bryobacteraceae bacterium]